MPYFKKLRTSLSLKLVLGCSLILTITLGISFHLIAKRQEKLIIEQIENEARVLFQQIIITRRWAADHGGVFVEKLPWTKPSPYLTDSEIYDVKGKSYLRKSPAMITKDLSRYAQEKGLYWFHITSLKLTNPENAPDEFEKIALKQFETSDKKELVSIEDYDGSRYMRYIAPLYVEEPCLKCHAHQNYKVGDIRGAISVTIPMNKTFTELSINKRNMFLAAITTLLILVVSIFFMLKRFVIYPMKKLHSSITSFSEGEHPAKDILNTGDEFENLYLAFSEMAEKLTDYHTCLHNKIKEATRDLEEANKKLISTNQLLIKSNDMKSDFIARASHELRTPLTSIKGAMDYISAKLFSFTKNTTNDNSGLNDLYVFFEIIKKNSDRLIRMVNDMLDIERIETGVSEMHFSNFDLSRIILETITNFQIDAGKKGIRFLTNLQNNLSVYADEDRIRQVITNLLSNAIKFSPEGSDIIVNAYIDHSINSVVSEIIDSGPGIPVSEHKKVFEKFYKSSNKEGTGLGLAICKSIIETHNGIIGVTDRGSGACFYFRLPIMEQSNDAPKQSDIIISNTPCR